METPSETGWQSIILDSIADGVYTVDASWRITSFNRAAEQTTGVSRVQAIGQHCCEVFRASICESQCALRHTLKTGQPVVNRLIYIVDAKGRRVPISISTALLRDQSGHVVGGVETFREDLFFRANVMRLELPPLRERRGRLDRLPKIISR